MTVLTRPDEPETRCLQAGALFGVFPTPENELRIPFDPLSEKWSFDHRLKHAHEAIHGSNRCGAC